MRPGAEPFRVANTTGPWPRDAWEGELKGLTRHVRLCFELATSKFEPPSEDGCGYFANCLLTYFLPNKEKKSLDLGRK
jgi:hypothetical protein